MQGQDRKLQFVYALVDARRGYRQESREILRAVLEKRLAEPGAIDWRAAPDIWSYEPPEVSPFLADGDPPPLQIWGEPQDLGVHVERADREPDGVAEANDPYRNDIRRQQAQAAYGRALAAGEWRDVLTLQPAERTYASNELNVIASRFDYAFYGERYAEALSGDEDAAQHYLRTGWKEGRNPAPWFDTKYYLETHPDVGSAGINPFWHYLVAGQREGRLPRGEISGKLAVLQSVRPLDVRTDHYVAPPHTLISMEALAARIRLAAGAAGLVVAASHDCYPTSIGGVQIFIADEQSKFNALGFVYLHLSPLRAALHMKDDAPEWTSTRIVLDGEIIGVASDADIAQALQLAGTPRRSLFIVHSPLGWSTSGLARIHSALPGCESFFWLHDYTSLCACFQLMRNDVEYCGAPDRDSEACRICIHQPLREQSDKRLRRLFELCRFTVVSPSEFTRRLWIERADLPHEGVLTVEHARLEERGERLALGSASQMGTASRPVRVAYVGYPTLQKGWATFERILDEASDYANYNFFHFGTAPHLRSRKNLRTTASAVTAADRDAMIRRLREHEIDLVVVAAEWPETFSYVTYEALAAGCDVVTLSRSGNVAATVAKLRRGLVFESADEVVDFFASGKAVAYARARAQFGACASELVHVGTTAALI